MRCNICDAALTKPTYNNELQAWEPCQTCLDVIFSVFTDSPEGMDEEIAAIDNDTTLDELFEIVRELNNT